MTQRRKQSRRRKLGRVYYQEPGKPRMWWMVRIKDATKPVRINGTLADALAGTPGTTIGCHLSNCAKRNAVAFPHPVLLASFTNSTLTIITKIVNGAPAEGVRYRHNYGRLVDLNDTDATKQFVRDHPRMAEREFILYPPRPPRKHVPGDHNKPGHKKNFTGEKQSVVLRGALRRAVKAGLIAAPIAHALETM